MKVIKKCASCGSYKIHLLLNLNSTPLANSFIEKKKEFKKEKFYPLKLYMCAMCKLVQIFHSIKPSEFFINYDYLSGASSSWISHCKKYANNIIKKYKLNPKFGDILEIASNDGTLIQNFHNKNFNAIGIEPSTIAHNIAKKKGINSINKFFNIKILKSLKKYKPQLIIANNVIAHVKNINNFLSTLSKVSAKNTIITIEFPFVHNLVNKMQFDTIYHEHHYYFSLYSISKLLNRHDLEIFDVEKISIHGGSYRIFVKTKDSKRKVKKKLYNFLKFEKQINLNSKNYYKNYQKLVNKVKVKSLDLIKKLILKKKTIHAYGAAAKGNTFLNFCKLNNNHISYIYDLNKKKVNKFLPGSHIKILPISEIKKRKPDYIIILPWNIFHEIKEQLKFTKRWGCKLIRLLPEKKL